MIASTDPIAIACELIRCPSVTPAEGGALQLLGRILESGGFKVERLRFSQPGTAPVENLYARIGEGWPHLGVCGDPRCGAAGGVERVDASAILWRDRGRGTLRPGRC